jgi:hypothetical protein
VWRGAGFYGSPPDAADWECDYQPATPIPGGGRPDLCLRPSRNGGQKIRGKPIFLESKVGSKLGEEQLRRYRDFGTVALVAITKNWPEVSRDKLASLGVKSLRWQEIAHELRKAATRRSQDRFVCDAFAEFLEESGMAYRESLTKTDLNHVRSILNKVLSSRYSEIVPGSSFLLAHNCLELLRDVRRVFLEENPRFTTWKTWGPGYFHEADGGHEAISHHAFGFDFFPERWLARHLCCRLYFPVSPSKPIYWYIRHRRKQADLNQEQDIALSRILTRNHLDPDKMARALGSAAESWKVR